MVLIVSVKTLCFLTFATKIALCAFPHGALSHLSIWLERLLRSLHQVCKPGVSSHLPSPALFHMHIQSETYGYFSLTSATHLSISPTHLFLVCARCDSLVWSIADAYLASSHMNCAQKIMEPHRPLSPAYTSSQRDQASCNGTTRHPYPLSTWTQGSRLRPLNLPHVYEQVRWMYAVFHPVRDALSWSLCPMLH